MSIPQSLLNQPVVIRPAKTTSDRRRLRRIAGQIRRWNLGVLRHDYPLDSIHAETVVTFANMRSGLCGGRLRNVRTHHLSLDDMMDLAGLLRVPHHPLRQPRTVVS